MGRMDMKNQKLKVIEKMRRNRLMIAVGLSILVFLLIQSIQAQCGPANPEEKAKIIDILQNEAAYDGHMVVVEGKIETECPSGCWFIINDQTASIYVDILPSNFVIPQKRGENAIVHGNVTTRNGDPIIIGKMVEINGETYQ